jgi:hypothetical protein
MSRWGAALCSIALTSCSAPPAAEAPFQPIEAPRAYQGLVHGSLGKATFAFTVPPRARRLEVEFAQPLRGARVDADTHAWARTFPALRDRRVGGAAVTVDWSEPDVDRLELTVHEHFRDRPVVRGWRFFAPSP